MHVLHRYGRVKIPAEDELNGLIDDLLHLHAKERPRLILIETLLHALMESNPRRTAKRFLTYNLPELIEEIKRTGG